MTMQTDTAILGAGPAGYVPALRAAQLGAQVVLIEDERIGGVRSNVGGFPTKAQLRCAEVCRVNLVLCKRGQTPGSEKAANTLHG